MRLVDTDAIEKELGVEDKDLYVQHILDSAPTIDAEPVRHGHWEDLHDGCYACSECHSVMDLDTPFCPYCGAKMNSCK